MRTRITYAAAAVATGLLLIATPVHAQGRALLAQLSGGSDANLGDVDGLGTVQVALNPGQSRICYTVEVEGLAPVSELRIVDIETRQTVVVLQEGLGDESGCVTVAADLVEEIRQNFSRYAASVATSQYPQGAIQGTLRLPAAAASDNWIISLPNAGAGLIPAAPGQNTVGESLYDHDQSFANDFKADWYKYQLHGEATWDNTWGNAWVDIISGNTDDKRDQKHKHDAEESGSNQGNNGQHSRRGGK